MDKTNYTVLSLVAIVALTAIVAMFLEAKAAEGITPLSEAAKVTANVVNVPRSGSLTGNVVASRPKIAAPEDKNPYDLNDNGRIDEKDAEMLGLVIDRVQFCPRSKKCDFDGNGKVTIEDLAVLNGELLKSELEKQNIVPAAPQEKVISIATTGGVV